MQRLVYILFRIVGFFFMLLPFSIMYSFSNGLAFLLHRVLKYRIKVINKNITIAFPEYTISQKEQLIAGFYRHLADLFVESFKSLSMSDKVMDKRYIYEGAAEINQFTKQGKCVILVAGHIGNWEWATLCIPRVLSHPVLGLYSPIKNEYIDKYMRDLRASKATMIASFKKAFSVFEKYQNEPMTIVLIADQSPGNIDKAHWVSFFGRETAAIHGPEKYGKQYHMPVVYCDIKRLKRGYYKVTFETMAEQPMDYQEGELTQKLMSKIEQDIKANPESWLWSHNRWKHSKN